jgi:rhodanese-related sulfurtransferase
VQAAQAAGLESSRHIDGGLQGWKNAEGPLIKP